MADKSINATTIDPLKTQSKAPLALAALQLLRVASIEWEFR
jgi:hypothetical protein